MLGAGFVQVEADLQVGYNGRQAAAEVGVVAASRQLLAHAFGQFIQVGIDALQGIVFLQQADGRLFANASHAGDVVGGIADQGLVIHHLVGAHAQVLQHIFGKIIFGIGAALAGQIHQDALVDELQQVTVAGDDLDAKALRGQLVSQAAEHIVGLVAFQLEARDIEGVYKLPDAFHLRAQVIRHLGPRGFIFGV